NVRAGRCAIPRYRMVHISGASPPAAKWRRDIVPDPPQREQCSHDSDTEDPQPAKNYTWAQLMARTFEFDVLQCLRCGGRMKIIAAIESPEVARRILDCLGIVSRPPPLLPARRQIVQLDSAEADFLVGNEQVCSPTRFTEADSVPSAL